MIRLCADPGVTPEMAVVDVSARACEVNLKKRWQELAGTTPATLDVVHHWNSCLPSLPTSESPVERCFVGDPERRTHLHRISEHLERREEVMYLAPVRTPLIWLA